MLPTKRIISQVSLNTFIASPSYTALFQFVTALNEAVLGVKLTDSLVLSPVVESLIQVLTSVHDIFTATPPVDNGASRFGNPAFKDFYDAVAAHSPELHRRIPGLKEEDIQEVSTYFNEAWGNKLRIDYGSGMELNFICWLFCLKKLGVIADSDLTAVVIRVFWKYMSITRLLQTAYWLEPAGSHGAQGLDDYHFAVFIFGSAQLASHKYLRPKAIHDKEILEEFSKDYMYFDYVSYINSIKTASLRWHSPMLDDISGVKTWAKINSGMLKMYAAEVLQKLPVAQHILFGTLLSYPASAPTSDSHPLGEEGEVAEGIRKDSTGHLHAIGHGGFGDCCGIAVPSRFAALEMEKKRLEGENGVRRIPFD